MQAAFFLVLLGLGAPPVPDTVVVCPPSFRPAMDRWVAHREAQGHRIHFLTNEGTPAEIRAGIRAAAAAGSLQYVVLVGDADPAAAIDPVLRRLTVPTHRAAAQVNVHWGSEPHIGTDNWYADLDDDAWPDLAVGRLTADSRQELTKMVEKILAYERSAPTGDWQRRVNLIAGAGGFGPLLDRVLEMATRQFLTEGIPPAYATTMTYGSWRSPYCPDPRLFHEITLTRMNEGCLLWVYMGHSRITFLDPVRMDDHFYHVLDTDDTDKLWRMGGPSVAVFLSCYSGAFDATRDCLAESMLSSAHGPVAVYCGSRVTMPYAMAVMGHELMKEYFGGQRETLGQVILHAKRSMVESRPADAAAPLDARRWLDAIAAGLSISPERLQAERLEHVLLFNLLGDPLLRLHVPRPIQMETDATTCAGQRLVVSGKTAIGGHLIVELVCRRDRTRRPVPRRDDPPVGDIELAAMTEAYASANDSRWCSTTLPCEAGVFRCELSVPEDARGPCFVRAFLDGPHGHGIGAAAVTVQAPDEMPRFAKRETAERTMAEEAADVGQPTER